MTDSFDLHPEIEIKILDSRLREWGLPHYKTAMAAAFDLCACVPGPVRIEPGRAELVSVGFALHIANPFVAADLLPRSGLGSKGLVLGNLVGLIDADYTGPVMVSLWNRGVPGSQVFTVEPGDRIAQMRFVPVIRPRLREVEVFSLESERGAGGFGSTGR